MNIAACWDIELCRKLYLLTMVLEKGGVGITKMGIYSSRENIDQLFRIYGGGDEMIYKCIYSVVLA